VGRQPSSKLNEGIKEDSYERMNVHRSVFGGRHNFVITQARGTNPNTTQLFSINDVTGVGVAQRMADPGRNVGHIVLAVGVVHVDSAWPNLHEKTQGARARRIWIRVSDVVSF